MAEGRASGCPSHPSRGLSSLRAYGWGAVPRVPLTPHVSKDIGTLSTKQSHVRKHGAFSLALGDAFHCSRVHRSRTIEAFKVQTSEWGRSRREDEGGPRPGSSTFSVEVSCLLARRSAAETGVLRASGWE